MVRHSQNGAYGGQQTYSQTGLTPYDPFNPFGANPFTDLDLQFQQMQIAPRNNYNMQPWQQMPPHAAYPAYPQQPQLQAPRQQDIATLKKVLSESMRVKRIVSETTKVSSPPSATASCVLTVWQPIIHMSFDDLTCFPDWRNVLNRNRDLFDFAIYSKGPIVLPPQAATGFTAVVSEGGQKAQYSKRSRLYTVEFTDLDVAGFKWAFDEVAEEIALSGSRAHLAIIRDFSMERLAMVSDLALVGYELPMGYDTREQLTIPYHLPPTAVIEQLGDLRDKVRRELAEVEVPARIRPSPEPEAVIGKPRNEVEITFPDSKPIVVRPAGSKE